MAAKMKPSEWAKHKQDEAKDGETAYRYHQLAEYWRGRGL